MRLGPHIDHNLLTAIYDILDRQEVTWPLSLTQDVDSV